MTDADSPILAPETFSYDPVGNRLTSRDTSGAWHYNRNNELLGYNHTSYEYDANGNMIQKIKGDTVTSYVYNTEDRLTEVWNEDPGTGTLIASYYYDPFGRRLWKEVSGKRTCFMYADEGLIAEMDATGNVTKSYGWHPDGTWGTDPLFMTENRNPNGTPRYYFYHNDHLGTPRKLTSTSGAVVWNATYSSFGEANVEPGSSVTNNLRFPGQYWDRETGLHYNWYRYYNSALGRYFRVDPIGLEGGINPYVYVDNGPIIKVDIKGLTFGFGFGVRFFIIGLSAERLWDKCCKDGKVIRRSIAKNCWSMGVGLSLKLLTKGFSPSLGGFNTNEGHCGQREWVVETEQKYGGDLVIYGRDSHSGNKWLPLALGGYYDIFQHCRYTVVSEKEVGCCSE